MNPNYIENLSESKLADVLTFVHRLEQTKIISRLYDGSRHIQSIGAPARYADVEIFAYKATLDAMNLAEAQAELLKLTYCGDVYLGYIEAPIDWDPIIKGYAYKGKIKFLIEG